MPPRTEIPTPPYHRNYADAAFFIGIEIDNLAPLPDLAATTSKSPCNAGAIHTGHFGGSRKESAYDPGCVKT